MSKSDEVYKSLLRHIESPHTIDGRGFHSVYLDNCRLQGQSTKQFRACLATLAKQGKYRVYDGEFFGFVLTEGTVYPHVEAQS